LARQVSNQDASDQDEVVVSRPVTAPRPHSGPRTVVIDDTLTGAASGPEVLQPSECIIANPAVSTCSRKTLSRVDATQDTSAAQYKATATAVYNYFLGFLPRSVPLCRAAFFSSELIRWATLIAADLDAELTLCCISEQHLVCAMAFVKVAGDFIKKNPALALSHPNIGLSFHSLVLTIESCDRALARQSAQNAAFESTPATVLLLEEAAAPVLIPAPEVTQPADLATSTTAAASEASEVIPTPPAPVNTSPAVTIDDDPTSDKITARAAPADNVPGVFSCAACCDKKDHAPRAPYYVTPRTASGLPCPTAGGKDAKVNNNRVNRAPSGLRNEKRTSSPEAVAASAVVVVENSQPSKAHAAVSASVGNDDAASPGFSNLLSNTHDGCKSIVQVGARWYLEAGVAMEIGCNVTRKTLLENSRECFQIVANHADKHEDFMSAEEQAHIKLSIDTITLELASFSAVEEDPFEGEQLIVSDIAFLKNVVQGAFPIENVKTLCYIGEICLKLGSFIKTNERNFSNGDARFKRQFETSVAAGRLASDLFTEIEQKYPTMINENLAKEAAKLCTTALFAQGKLEMLLEAANNKDEFEAPAEAPLRRSVLLRLGPSSAGRTSNSESIQMTDARSDGSTNESSRNNKKNNRNNNNNKKEPRVSVLQRLGSSSSGPTSGDSTPMSDAGAVVSINEAATEVAASTTAKPKRKGRKNRSHGRRRS
jgi:hypothetical protein